MTTRISRRAACGATLALGFTSAVTYAQVGDYPGRSVKVIVPFVPGGNADTTARIVAEAYGQRLGQTFVIENRGGAGGMIGAAQMVRSEADGYTLMIGTTSPIVAGWLMAGKSATYGLKDMTPVALLSLVPGVLVVPAGSSVKNYADFVALAKARPAAVSIGHPGNATAGHVNILQMQRALGKEFVAVAYKGAGPAVQDLLGGQLDAVATDLPSVLQLVKGGKLRVLAVVFPQRVASLPDVPTMAELKQPEVDIAPFTAVMAPRGLSGPVLSKLVQTTNALLADPGVRQRLEAIGGVPMQMSTADFEKFLAAQVATFSRLVDSGLLKAE